MEWKLELIAVPVSDVDRAKAFYTEVAGFTVDHDHTLSEELRFVSVDAARLGLLDRDRQGARRERSGARSRDCS